MKFIISGKNIEVTEGIKAAIEEKLGRLDKYLVDDTIVNVTLSVQKGRQKIEVTIPMKGHIIRAEEGSEDMYVSIDLVVDVIERQIRRYKTRLMNQKYDEQASNRNLWSRKTMWKMMRSESSEARSLLSNQWM